MRTCSLCGASYDPSIGFCPNDGSPLPAAPPPDDAPDPLVGRVIDRRYRVDRVIGRGGMGVVYATTHVSLGKRLALKVLRGEQAGDAETVQRFVQEARSASSIGHPNIIAINDFGSLPDGAAYFVMEYLEGGSLGALVAAGGPPPLEVSIHIVRQIASALEAAHARGIVHRDLKPDNIHLVRQGEDPYVVKVLDFGIAKVGGATSKLTKTGMIFGTPHYMAPEQASGQAVDARTDVYALGVIAYEMVTGTVPFDADTFMAILSKHLFTEPRRPSEVTGRPIGSLEDVILRALAKKPEDRYPSMAALVEDLDRVAAGGRALVVPRAAATGVPPTLEMSIEDARATGPGGVPSRMVAWVGVGLGALGLVGLVVAALFFVLAGPGPAASTPPPIVAVPPTPIAPIAPVAPPVAPPAIARVEVRSEPAGADVSVDGALVGTTPAFVRAPSGDETVAVEIRAPGHEPAHLALRAGGPDAQTVVLVPVAPPSARAPRPARAPSDRMRAPRPPAAAATPEPRAPAPPPRRPTEVVDPWG